MPTSQLWPKSGNLLVHIVENTQYRCFCTNNKIQSYWIVQYHMALRDWLTFESYEHLEENHLERGERNILRQLADLLPIIILFIPISKESSSMHRGTTCLMMIYETCYSNIVLYSFLCGLAGCLETREHLFKYANYVICT